MPDLNQLNQEVASLSKTESDDFAFMDAIDHIEDSGKSTDDDDIATLRDILHGFRSKLPNRETLDAVRVRAKDLADTLMLTTLSQRLARIKGRNDALLNLNATLQTQIAKANNDAGLLKQIKDAVDKATKTVEEVKAIVSQLTATDSSVKDKLTALIDGLANVSTIFAPENA